MFRFALLIAIFTTFVHAKNYALLVGINYNGTSIKQLGGAVNDVDLIEKELLKQGYDKDSIATLKEKAATKKNIMKAINDIANKSLPGDFIYMHFSGHGVSYFTEGNAFSSLAQDTAGFAPYDAILAGSYKKIVSSLIIGRYDLRPILEKLDKDRHVFVILDSCFSANTTRAIGHAAGTLNRSAKAFADDDTSEMQSSQVQVDSKYPYQNIITMSAADKNETATDLELGRHSDILVGNKPQGAFTNFFVKGLSGEADLNHDGKITYHEIHSYISREIKNAGIGQTPQLFPDPNQSKLSDSAVFQSNNTQCASKIEEYKTKIKIEPSAKDITSSISSLGISIGDKKHTYLLSKINGKYTLFLNTGDKLAENLDKGELLVRLRRFAKIDPILHSKNSCQNSNIFLQHSSGAGRSVFFDGEELSFTIQSEKHSKFLFFDVDSTGMINVLLPSDIGEVGAPFGVERLKAFAFSHNVPSVNKFSKQSIDPNTQEFVGFQKMLEEIKSGNWSQTDMLVVTQEKGKK